MLGYGYSFDQQLAESKERLGPLRQPKGFFRIVKGNGNGKEDP
jgi:hypothetical protein